MAKNEVHRDTSLQSKTFFANLQGSLYFKPKSWN